VGESTWGGTAVVIGALTGTPHLEYIALLQEDVESGKQSAATLAAERDLASAFILVRDDVSRVSGNSDHHPVVAIVTAATKTN